MDELEINMLDGVYKNAKEFLEHYLGDLDPDLKKYLIEEEAEKCDINLDTVRPSKYLKECHDPEYLKSLQEMREDLSTKSVGDLCYGNTDDGLLYDKICQMLENKIEDILYDNNSDELLAEIIADKINDNYTIAWGEDIILRDEINGEELAIAEEEYDCRVDYNENRIWIDCPYWRDPYVIETYETPTIEIYELPMTLYELKDKKVLEDFIESYLNEIADEKIEEYIDTITDGKFKDGFYENFYDFDYISNGYELWDIIEGIYENYYDYVETYASEDEVEKLEEEGKVSANREYFFMVRKNEKKH